MSKITMGVIVGAVLGFVDGVSAILTPAVHSIMLQIVIGSTMKGFATGLVAGYVARRTNTIKWTIVAGLAVGLVLSFTAAYLTPDPDGRRYYWEIMLPGAVLGVLAGYASQRFGATRRKLITS